MKLSRNFNIGQSGRSREQIIANAAFFALFPGFFFYHTLLGTDTISAFLGGYFSPISLVFAVPLTVILFGHYQHKPRTTVAVEFYYAAFLVYFLIVVACNTAAGANRAIVANHVLCILFMFNAFIIFTLIDFSSPIFRRMAIMSLAVMSGIAFNYSVNGVFYLGAMGIAKDADSLATYQGFARSYLITYLPVIAFTRALVLRLVLYGLAITTLFLNTARSEFVALLFIVPIFELYFSRHKLIFMLTAVATCMVLYINADQLMAALPDNRILELLDLSHSTSANKRHQLSIHAMQTIMAHPLLGDYASYAPGYYAHNILSAWVDLGLFGFIYLILIMLLPAIPLFLREYFSKRFSGHFILAFGLVCSTTLLLLTSHYFTDMLIGATVGAYAQYEFRRKYGKHCSPDVSPSTPRYPHICQTMSHHGSTGA